MITILCSAYNASDHLDRYLDFVNQQTLPKFEIVFVDAKSTDDTLTKIIEYKFRDGISKKVFGASERIGIYEAWNIAIDNSSYEYVMNYNCDDKIFPTSLHTYATYATLNPDVDVIYSDSFIAQSTEYKPHSWYSWADANVKQNLLNGCCVGPYPLLKKSTIVEAGGFDSTFKISGDYEMWCRLNSLGKTFLKIDELIGVYYLNPEGVSTVHSEERHNTHITEDTKIRTKYA
jgi:glycosyltransferase involved in cell wall biosynthesis